MSKTVLFVVTLFIAVASGMFWHVKTFQTNLTQQAAIGNAKLISTTVRELQKLSSDESGSNHVAPEAISLALGNRVGQHTLQGAQAIIYSPYPFPSHKEAGGLNDAFRTEAWRRLQENPKEAVFQFFIDGQKQLLRYAIATHMAQSCVDCHNQLKDSPKKNWQAGEISGVIEVNVPLKNILPKEDENLRLTILVYSGILLCGIVGIILMIIKQKHYNDELTRLTSTDPLTGLFNQYELIISMKRETEKVKRGGDSLCLMYFDIDGFKQINDTLGHLKGDELLKYIGKMLPGLIRTFDVPCRYTGDEFCILLPGCTTSAAVQIGERIIEKLHQNYPDVQLSMGISLCDKNNFMSPDDLMKQAIANKNTAKDLSGYKIKA